MTLDLAAVAREAAARWRQDREILAPLSGLTMFLPQWATLMLVPALPALPANPDPAAVQRWAEAAQRWFGSYGLLIFGAFVVAQLGQLAVVALYVGDGAGEGGRPTVGGALARAGRRLVRFLLAGIVVSMPSATVALLAASAPVLLVAVVPVLVYVLGPDGAARRGAGRAARRGGRIRARSGRSCSAGAGRAAQDCRWRSLSGGLLIVMSVAIQVVQGTIEALAHAGIGNPVVTAALDAGAAGVAWAAMLALAMMQAVLYRRLAR